MQLKVYDSYKKDISLLTMQEKCNTFYNQSEHGRPRIKLLPAWTRGSSKFGDMKTELEFAMRKLPLKDILDFDACFLRG